uniref:Putative secreted salivary gland peptide n=1 Tax=Ixodes scapularis TaxID=6945 RepID=Q5Q990_IXOSC|nr:putative secreted salivary gland peptide [Ixodes scapularis]
MIRMVILPLSVVLLTGSVYIHAANPKEDADACSPGLGDYIKRVCSNSGTVLASFSECSYTCNAKKTNGLTSWTKRNLPDGLPCGKCRECCGGSCTAVQFNLENPLTVKSCAK